MHGLIRYGVCTPRYKFSKSQGIFKNMIKSENNDEPPKERYKLIQKITDRNRMTLIKNITDKLDFINKSGEKVIGNVRQDFL